MLDQNARGAAAVIAGEHGTDLQNTEDFSFLIWREIFRATVRNEKKALERWQTVSFEIEVMERELLLPGEVRSIIKLQLECEPGKPPRLATTISSCSIQPHREPSASSRPR